jgi:hypothetical protein
MAKSKDYSGKNLRLRDVVAYVEVEDKGVLIDLKKRQQFFPNSGVARMLLSLLSSKMVKGIHFDNLKEYCLRIYAIGSDQAVAALNAFLTELDNLGLIESTSGKPEGVRLATLPKRMEWHEPDIYGGGTFLDYHSFIFPVVPFHWRPADLEKEKIK